MSTLPIFADEKWELPSRGKAGMLSLIIGECGIFGIFVAAYIFYIGRSISGPTPRILEVPIFNTVCLLSSSLTIWFAEHAIEKGRMRSFAAWWGLTIALGLIFISGTIAEWRTLIFRDGLTIHTNLFGTTFYSLVGLHASHVIVGLIGLSTILLFTLLGRVNQSHTYRIQTFALYWHFVDAVWVVVFITVYIVGR
jgi:cytochrome c oxidase subunit 3